MVRVHASLSSNPGLSIIQLYMYVVGWVELSLSQRNEIFTLQSVRVSKFELTISEDFPKTPGDVLKNMENVLKFHDAFARIPLKKNNLLGFLPSKSVNQG